MKRLLVFVSLAVLAACGDDDDKASCPYKVAVYELTVFEKNEMMCEAGGEDLLSAAQGEGQSHFIATCSVFFGQVLHTVYSCGDEASCQETYNEYLESELLGGMALTDYTFAFTGELKQIQGTGDECSEGDYSEAQVSTDGDTITAYESSWALTDVGEDEEGFCNLERAETLAAARPCDARTTITGRLLQSSP